MNQTLRSLGVQLLVYSPRQVDPSTGVVEGWIISNGKFVRVRTQVPAINGSWYIGRDRSLMPTMDTRQFRAFVQRNGMEVYPHRGFSSVLKDKLKTARMIREFDPSLHPRTELYEHDEAQLSRLASRYRAVFLKPRFGSKGNDIVSVRRTDSGFRCAYYRNREKQETLAPDLAAAFREIETAVGRRRFLIQQGIRIDEHDGMPFIVRVIMLDDGRQWRWINKGVLAAPGSEIANTTQGGSNMKTIELFRALYGNRRARELFERLRHAAFSFVHRLDNLFPGELMEVAFDFVVNTAGQLKILEINTLPGMTKPGMRPEPALSNVFNPDPSELTVYEKLIRPHGSYLGRFLHSKLKERLARGEPDLVQSPVPLVTHSPESPLASPQRLDPAIIEPGRPLLHQVIERQARQLLLACLPSGAFHTDAPKQAGQKDNRRFSALEHLEAIGALNAFNDLQPNDDVLQVMFRAGGYLRTGYVGAIPGCEHLLGVWSSTEFSYLGSPEHVRLGWTGLGLMALISLERFHPGFTSVEVLRAMGEFLIWGQNGDGSVRSLFVPSTGGWNENWSSLDHPGQAAIALLLLHDLDPSPRWLRAASNIFLHLIRAAEETSSAPADYWTLTAIARLNAGESKVLPPETWRQLTHHAGRICETLLDAQQLNPGDARLLGAFSEDGQTEQTARYIRGLLAAESILEREHRDLYGRLRRAVDLGIDFLVRACTPERNRIESMPRVFPPRLRNTPPSENEKPRVPALHLGSVCNGLHAMAEQAHFAPSSPRE